VIEHRDAPTTATRITDRIVGASYSVTSAATVITSRKNAEIRSG
jgi:hypothetical protein